MQRDPGRLLQPTAASAREPRKKPEPKSAFGSSNLHSASASGSAFGSSSLRFDDGGGGGSSGGGGGGARPSSASANRHSARMPSWRAGVR